LRSTATVVEVRLATLADEAALAAIDRATWSTLSSPAPPPPEGWTFFDEGTRPEQILVALEEGEVAGYAKLRHPTSLPATQHVLAIHGLAVDPGRQRRGIGRALIDASIREARGRHVRRLTLRVLGPNVVARRLYESAGFVVEGILPEEFFLDGAYVDDVLMAIDLTD
jgi:ribosomal protein S18 acetylase RimI-like enzyme